MLAESIQVDLSLPSRAILFDVDGVLVDSYQAHLISWQLLASRYHRTCTPEDFARGFGRTTREVLLDQWPDYPWTDAELLRIDEEKEQLYRDVIARDFPAMPGARELIVHLVDQGWQVGLGSSGPRENVDLAILMLEIGPLLGAAISGHDVREGKPAPDVFLQGAARLGVPPGRCIVIEDAVPGLAAARAAGMKCVGFVSQGRHARDLESADLLIHALAELNSDRLLRLLEES